MGAAYFCRWRLSGVGRAFGLFSLGCSLHVEFGSSQCPSALSRSATCVFEFNKKKAIIEETRGDGTETKNKIDADYRKGIVRSCDLRIGELVNGEMVLQGEGKKLEARYKKLME